MGDPKKLKKKYSSPVHPWNKTVLDEERLVKVEYALRNKQELFRANSFLKKYKMLAKKLIAQKTEQGEKEKEQILEKLQRLGLLQEGVALDDILGLQLKDILERRLQSVIFRKGLAKSMKQARQFITHRHVTIKGKELTAPSYLLSLEEENQLAFKEKSSLADEEHPERAIKEQPVKEVKKEKETEKSKEEKPAKKSPAKKVKQEKPKKEIKEESKPVEEKKEEKVAEKPPKEEVEEKTEEQEK